MKQYTVLALKWRPKGFEEVVGQSHVVESLTSAIEKNKLGHAYMFSGPRGVGKTSCARILAKALNCKQGPTARPCGTCPACADIAAGRSLDVIEIDGASNRGIDEIRSLRESVKFAPAAGRYKVYIIDEVHQITSDGFNALLKTLEEPPEFVKFILATTAPQKVPSTILSRCQRMDFRRISVLEMIAQLEKIIAAEGGKVERDVLFAVARASDGALRDAESILDQLLAFSKDTVSLEDVTQMLGNVQMETLFQLGEACQARDSHRLLSLINELIDKGKDPAVLLQDLISHFRNLMVARVAGPDIKLIDLPEELCARLVKQAQGFTLEELFAAFAILIETQEMARRMESPRIPLEVNLIRICRRGEQAAASPRPSAPSASAARPQTAVAQGHHAYGKPAVPPAAPKPAAVKPVAKKEESVPAPFVPETGMPDPHVDEVRKGFDDVIREVAKSRMSVATYLREGAVEKVERGTLSIGFARGLQFHKDFLEKKENRALLEKCFSERFGKNLRVILRLTEEEAAPRPGVIEDSPAVRSAMDTFHGRLI